MEVALGILSFVVSIVAIVIAIKSGQVIKDIANLNYDEKLAITASHLERIIKDQSLDYAFIERIKNDFSAVSNLKKYMNTPKGKEKKEELIENYIIPILETILNGGNVSGQCAVAVNEMIDIALTYNIAIDKIKSLKQKLRVN